MGWRWMRWDFVPNISENMWIFCAKIGEDAEMTLDVLVTLREYLVVGNDMLMEKC